MKKQMAMNILLGALLAVVLYVNAMAAGCWPVYLDNRNGDDANSGATWDSAKRTWSGAAHSTNGPVFLVVKDTSGQPTLYVIRLGVEECAR